MIYLSKLKPEIERICRLLPVKRLGLYGSALTQSFSPSSDVDILVVFDSNDLRDTISKMGMTPQISGAISQPFSDIIFTNS